MFILYFFYTESGSKYQEDFPESSLKNVFIIWKMECYCFHKFYKSNSLRQFIKY